MKDQIVEKIDQVRDWFEALPRHKRMTLFMIVIAVFIFYIGDLLHPYRQCSKSRI